MKMGEGQMTAGHSGQGNPFHSMHQGTHQACYAMWEYGCLSISSSTSVRVVMKELIFQLKETHTGLQMLA